MAIVEAGLDTAAPRGAGEVPMHHPALNTRTLIAEGVIKFGRAVMPGTAGDQGLVYGDPAKAFLGVAAKSVEATDLDTEAYADKDVLGVVDSGIVNVYVEEAVALGAAVRVRHTADTGKYVGDFAVTADPDKTVVLAGAEWRSTCAAAGVVALYISPKVTVTADES